MLQSTQIAFSYIIANDTDLCDDGDSVDEFLIMIKVDLKVGKKMIFRCSSMTCSINRTGLQATDVVLREFTWR